MLRRPLFSIFLKAGTLLEYSSELQLETIRQKFSKVKSLSEASSRYVMTSVWDIVENIQKIYFSFWSLGGDVHTIQTAFALISVYCNNAVSAYVEEFNGHFLSEFYDYILASHTY